MKRRLRSTIAIGLVAGGLVWILGDGPETGSTGDQEPSLAAEPMAPQAGGEVAEESRDAHPDLQTESARTPASLSPTIDVVLSDRVKDSLLEFKKAQKVVLATSSEDEDRIRLLKERMFQDASLMRELEMLLKAPAYGDQDLAAHQLTALDVLFDAMRSKSADLAEKVLASIVEDRSVEDDSLDSRSRQALAEVKAEVLYRWSAAEPDQADQIVGLLPGPVSQKIWGNVVDAQMQNTAESQFEATHRGQTRSTAH